MNSSSALTLPFLYAILLLSFVFSFYIPSRVDASTHLTDCRPGVAQRIAFIHIGDPHHEATRIELRVRLLKGVYQPNEQISANAHMDSDDYPDQCPGVAVNGVSFGFPTSQCYLQAGQEGTEVVGNAPSVPGTYSMWWSVSNTWPNYRPERICPMTYTVVAPPPTVSFSASPTTIDYGGQSTLTWSSTNTTSCSGDGQDGFYTGGKTSGSKKVSPGSKTTYTVTCTGSGGTVSKTAVVNVNNPGPTARLTASPVSITRGDSSVLTWSSTNAASCTGSGFSTGNATSGTRTVSPNNTTTYSVTCTGAGGSASDNAEIIVSVPTGTCEVGDPDCPPGTGEPPGGGTGSTPSCMDGVDNDNDTYIDSSDPDCNRAGGEETVDNRPECSDERDNDGDEKIDYPDDRACPSPTWDDEIAPDALLSITAFPNPTRKNTATELSWDVVYGHSCTLSGSNGDYWVLAGNSGKETSAPLPQESLFTLRCLNLDDVPFFEEINVKLLPSFEEQ